MAGSDYTAKSGSITIPAGGLTGTITISVIADTVPEDNETFNVVLSNPLNAVLANNVAQGTIENDDGANELNQPCGHGRGGRDHARRGAPVRVAHRSANRAGCCRCGLGQASSGPRVRRGAAPQPNAVSRPTR